MHIKLLDHQLQFSKLPPRMGETTFANATILKQYLAALRSKNIPISQTTADAVIHDYGGTLWKWTGEK